MQLLKKNKCNCRSCGASTSLSLSSVAMRAELYILCLSFALESPYPCSFSRISVEVDLSKQAVNWIGN